MCRSRIIIALLLAAASLTLLAQTGCKIDSADSVIRDVPINVAGVYRNADGRIITQHTGAAITSMNVIQNGSELQGIDNNGMVFRGSIGSVTGEGNARLASFTLRGLTTAGQEGVISGTFSASGNEATMRGTWAEPTTFGNVLATASVAGQPDPPATDNDVPGTNSVGNAQTPGNDGNGNAQAPGNDGNGNGSNDTSPAPTPPLPA